MGDEGPGAAAGPTAVLQVQPGEAKKLLEAAGQTNLQLKLAYPNTFAVNPVFSKQAETIVNMLGAVGVKMSIVMQDYKKDFIGAAQAAAGLSSTRTR